MMEVSPPEDMHDSLVEKLIESRSFKNNKIHWSLFYGSVVAIGLMFIILCSLASWSISIASEINGLVTQAGKILDDVEEMLPVLKDICRHQNFTKNYGNICDKII